jgi:protein NirF
MEFAPRGHEVWLSIGDADEVQVWNTLTLEKVASLPAIKPSGIFFTARAHRTGL